VKNTLEIKMLQSVMLLKAESDKEFHEWLTVFKQQKSSIQQKLDNIEKVNLVQ
jgi:hypothetical protein